MKYPYLTHDGKYIDIDFPEHYAIKLRGEIKDVDLVFNDYTSQFIQLNAAGGITWYVSDFQLVITPVVK